MRKIVQFQGVPDEHGGHLYVLCDDGSIWMCQPQFIEDGKTWMRVRIPPSLFHQPKTDDEVENKSYENTVVDIPPAVEIYSKKTKKNIKRI